MEVAVKCGLLYADLADLHLRINQIPFGAISTYYSWQKLKALFGGIG